MENIFDAMFTIVPILMILMIAVFFIVFILNFVKNKKAPIISVEATVIGKRVDVSGGGGVNNNVSASTWYYITFQTEHGERLELSLSGRTYGMLQEGDKGTLIYQGQWFKDFKRNLGTY